MFSLERSCMSEINWEEEFGDEGNSIWFGASPFTTDSDPLACPDVYWRLKQRLRENEIEWYAAHDSELGGETGGAWLSLEEAKSECQRYHDYIIATESCVE